MAKNNQHIEKYLNAYREMNDVDFAVMITGPWGCGKTHFIEDYLKRECTKNEEKEYIYVSLNGLANTADIDMALFQTAHPILGSKIAVTAGKIFKASVKAGLKVDFDINNDGKADGSAGFDIPIDSFKLKAKSGLLVFDDLERCLLKPEEVLGYINAFVESKKTKVIVIGDETKIGTTNSEKEAQELAADLKNPSSKYWMIKEKVVGKTFRLSETMNEVFDDLVSIEAYPKTYELIARNKDVVVRMFQTVSTEDNGKCNYRALKHSFRDFEYFYPIVDEQFLENDEFLDALCRIFISLAYEVQLANLSPEEFSSADPSEKLSRYTDETKKEEKESNFEIVLNRHNLDWDAFYSTNNMIFDKDLWADIFANNWIDRERVFEAIQNSSFFPADRPEWINLWYWRQLEDEEAVDALNAVKKNVDTFAYTSCEIILHVFSILITLADKGVIDCPKENVFNDVEIYLDTLVLKKLLEQPDSEREWRFSQWSSHGLQYTTSGNDYERLSTMIDEARSEMTKIQRIQSVDSWLNSLRQFDGEFLRDIGLNGKYCQEPVLNHIAPEQLFGTLVELPNSQKFLTSSAFKKRYEYFSEKLIEELPLWVDVLELLSEKISEHTDCVTPTIENLKQVKKDVESIVESLRNISKEEGSEC